MVRNNILRAFLAQAILAPASALVESIVGGGACAEFGKAHFNATGSVQVDEPSFNRSGLNAQQWTYHTGLVADRKEKGTVEQAFWLDTTGSVDLNSPNVPYKTCIVLYERLPRKAYDQAPNDKGDCEAMMGSKCLAALRRHIGGGDCNQDLGSLNIDECKDLAPINSEATATEPYSTWPGCNSTLDNASGAKNVFFWVRSRNGTSSEPDAMDPNYDGMARRSYLIFHKSYVTTGSSNANTTTTELQTVCLRNTNFTDGSRVPDALKPSPSGSSKPSGSPTPSGKPGAAADMRPGLAAAVLFGVLAVFL